MGLNSRLRWSALLLLYLLTACSGQAKGASGSDCLLCGRGNLTKYYASLDLLGVVNLTNGHITPLDTFQENEDGSLNTGSSMTANGDGDGRIVYTTIHGNRGICSLKIFWEPEEPLEPAGLKGQYCEGCMSKIMALDDGRESVSEQGRCPFALIDCTTMELYSLNGFYTPILLRDYYLELHFKNHEGEIEGAIFYAPEKSSRP